MGKPEVKTSGFFVLLLETLIECEYWEKRRKKCPFFVGKWAIMCWNCDNDAVFMIKGKWIFDKKMVRNRNKGCSNEGMGVLFKLF